ncbi:MAG: hypothetical protein E3J35_04465 [Methanomassiliicoccales archaeon]|nr:MAG: hypothetical protein E3J35_04465 [Methanomassiliicoccales archaeon]
MRRAGLIITCFTLTSVFHAALILPEEVSGYTSHAPIHINGNGEFTAANGVTGGIGTPSSPYIIEGWEINASTERGIYIRNTNAHFIIRDVYVHSGILAHPPHSGILLSTVMNGQVENSLLTDNIVGIGLRAINITIRANTFTSNGITIEGFSLEEHNTHTITSDNLVNGKPLYYYKDCTNLHIDGEIVGQLIIVNCTDIKVTNLELSDPGASIGISFSEDVSVTGNTVSNGFGGIGLGFSTNATVFSNNIENSWVGIGLGYVNNSTVTNNRVTSNSRYGIHFEKCYGVLISNNTLSDNNISLGNERSDNITIEGNTVQDSDYGIGYLSWISMLVHHNNFVNNTIQVLTSSGSGGTWDNGYPSGGNYWSDYTGIDLFSGPNQDQPGSDGIGDTAYPIDTDGQDRYPLMSPIVPPPPENQPPICSIQSPMQDDTISGVPTISGTASDQDGTVESVEVRIDNGSWIEVTGTTSWSFEWDTKTVPDGEHTIYARSFDGTDYSTEANITVIVDNAPPQGPQQDWFWISVAMIAVTVVILLLIIIILLRRRERIEEEEAPEKPL